MSLPLKPFKKAVDYVGTKPDGTKAWIGLATGIAVYDMWAMMQDKETMSAAFERAVNHPFKRWIVIACWAFTTKHLFVKKFLANYDPFIILALMVKGLRLIFKESTNGLANA